jgi:transposase-like protein
LPDQQTFQRYLRELVRGAIRVVLETVMREELDALIGVGWGNVVPSAKAIAMASIPASLSTSTGRIEDVKVPRDREGQFHTQVFERYSRDAPHIAEGLTQMFVAGTSTRHPWGKWLKRSWESLEVASTISRLNQSLTHQFEAWRERPLQEHWRVVYLDGVHFSIRHGDQCDATIILTA